MVVKENLGSTTYSSTITQVQKKRIFQHVNELSLYYWKHIFDLRIYHEFGIVSFWKPILAFWELLIALNKEDI
jgi:hypothetical protein